MEDDSLDWESLFGSDNDSVDWNSLFGSNDEKEDDDRYSTDIPGLELVREALDHSQQMKIIQAILDTNTFSDAGRVNQAMCFGKLPPHLDWLSRHIKNQLPHLLPRVLMQREPVFDQAILNLYRKGEGIVSHVDLARFEDGVVILSLMSSCVMTMRPVPKVSPADPSLEVDILLNPGDILALSGLARYEWEHGIKECEYDVVRGERIERGTRISVTLRKLGTTVETPTIETTATRTSI
ncbi:hypothetical protein J3Q64DRAFT_1827126 [Phycomyces blakesleeanus]|uniref:Fe2OG dioxygenase domain-containing protein n=2 Tax=Phycomyces blakesleeanus TaxID=4837 RepID=A0A163B275_PHYB8|nr:hypothetical protein PHYBLDRAFT_68613 [Phycomyces blakesleeanus NRRL 1555(-)]OAD77881.1 hypothetical protein PHYBLDRAFT_68613 [Phycomyces blakesleeanus NRRL 1555(-)]|eukprot:XP_018295921.1 hypothetical protein PHYBLDRAFT_68613 [Phycomyces blakesleeanus NRRL 1555(-)]